MQHGKNQRVGLGNTSFYLFENLGERGTVEGGGFVNVDMSLKFWVGYL